MHLSPLTALDFLAGRLNEQEQDFWTRHLATCRNCTQELDRWRQIQTDLKRSHLKNAPDPDLEKVLDIFPRPRAEARSVVRTILAAVIFDSAIELQVAGARGVTSGARQVVLRAEEFDIHVKIWGEQDRRQMLGQLLPRSGENFVQAARFHLLRNGERLETTVVDEIGEFHFTDVPDGDLSLQIDLPNLTVIGALKSGDPQGQPGH